MTEKLRSTLLLAALAAGLLAAGCATDPDSPPYIDGEQRWVAAGAVDEAAEPRDVEDALSIPAADLDHGLPGCLEALRDPDLSLAEGEVELFVVRESRELALLTVGADQICVDDVSALHTWVATGRWPADLIGATGKGDAEPTTYSGEADGDEIEPAPSIVQPDHEPPALPGEEENLDDTHLLQPSVDPSGRDNVSNDPMDDSNPLPPRPDPLL
jgi:hypothetical protein